MNVAWRRFGLGIGAIAVLAGVGAVATGGSQVAADPADAADAATKNGEGAGTLRCNFRVDDRHAWRMTNRVSLRQATPNTKARAGESTETSVQMRWQVVAADASIWRVHVALADAVAVELPTESFGLEIGADCRFRRIGLPGGWQPAQRNAVRGLLQATAIVLSERKGVRAWSASQADPIGTFTAAYRVDGGELVRTWQAYSRLWGGEQSGRWTNMRTELRARLANDGGWVTELNSTTHQHVSALGSAAVGAGRASAVAAAMQWKLEQRATARRVVGLAPPVPSPSGLRWGPLDVGPETLVARSARTPQEYDKSWTRLRLREVLQRLVAHRAQHGRRGQGLLSDRLAGWIRANPQGAAELIRGMKDGLIPEEIRSVLFLGLEKAATPAAHRALVGAANDPDLAEPDRLRAIAALSGFRKPSTETLDALASLARPGPGDLSDLQTSATLAIGALADDARRYGPEMVAPAIADLRGRLEDPVHSEQLVVALQAAGNAASVELLPAVQPYLDDERRSVRNAALESLGRLPPAATEDWFAPMLAAADNVQARTRVAMVYAKQAGLHGGPTATVLAGALAQLHAESHPAVRRELVAIIGASKDPAAHQALVGRMKRESNGSVLVELGRHVAIEELDP